MLPGVRWLPPVVPSVNQVCSPSRLSKRFMRDLVIDESAATGANQIPYERLVVFMTEDDDPQVRADIVEAAKECVQRVPQQLGVDEQDVSLLPDERI